MTIFGGQNKTALNRNRFPVLHWGTVVYFFRNRLFIYRILLTGHQMVSYNQNDTKWCPIRS